MRSQRPISQRSPWKLGARRVPSLRERPPAGVLEPAVEAADREGHVGFLRPDPELAEETPEQRVVPLVVDEEARVEREAVDGDGVDVSAGPLFSLEDLDLVRAGEHVGGPEAGDAAAHHCHPHHVGSSLRRSSCVADGIFTFQTRRSFSSARITHQETSSCRRPSPCRAEAGNA